MIIQAPLNDLGYGVAGFNIVKELSQLTDVTVHPLGNIQIADSFLPDIEKLLWINKPVDKNQPNLKIYHQFGLTEFVGKAQHIGYTFFELDKFTDVEKKSIQHCDKIITCSEWGKAIIEDQVPGVDAQCIPLGVNRSIFNEHNNSSRKSTIFFNAGKWEIRKGHDVLLKCFEKAFSQDDNVELWLLCENPFYQDINKQWNDYYRNSKLANKIRILPRQKNHQDVYNIMRQVDAGVFPVKAEGWNLELLELLSCGKHVVTTNYSGHTEFTNSLNSYLVDIEEMQPAHDGIWFFGQGNWAKIGDKEIDNFAENMRYIHKLKQEGELGLNIAGIETARQFSWENTAREILNGI